MPDVPLTPGAAVLSATAALQLIADAGEVLASSLDYQETLRRVARLAVPNLADWCAVYISADGELEQELTSGHPDDDVGAMLLAVRADRRRRGASESQAVAGGTAP